MTMHTAPLSAPPWWRPGLVIGLGLVALTVPGMSAPSAVRVIVLLAFLIVGPGLALVGLLDIPDPWRESSLVIGVSLALDVLVIGLLTYAGNRTAGDGIAVLTGVAFVGAAVQFVRLRHRGGDGKAGS
ncbi:MAG TPA: hypothetical protein VN520_08010 [Streptomyces sp.]|uniref:hypothetical protein n=1 Tax=Streptomyces sp. TaxID=1931 RepID=UPI002C162CDA|nr:hypothetical protein [Streptomyces sp.]HWU06316.1 hypothetical protein [Streptomyces sp.]